MRNFIEGWYVVYTHSRHEKKVAMYFSENSIISFSPMIKQLRVWHDRKKFVDAPLFPSYVFVHLKNNEEYHKALKTDGILYFLKTGNEITRVAEQIMSNLLLLDSCSKEIEVSDDYFHQGQHISINDGPLTGLSGEIVQFNGKQHVLVRVNLLRRNILLSISSRHLKMAFNI